jgi:hypothetical protein
MEASELPRWFLDNRQQNLKLEWGAMIGTMSESPPPYSQDELTSKLTLTEMLPLIALSGSFDKPRWAWGGDNGICSRSVSEGDTRDFLLDRQAL